MEPSDFSTSIHTSMYSRTLSLALWRLRREAFGTSSSTLLTSSDDQRSTPGRRKGRTWSSWVLLACVFLSVTTITVDACGPGRGSGRRRAPRKLTPIVYKQHVPNVPENALSASGLSEGKILRGDTQRFKDLVPNYNPDILFRDDEGTGADRLMTQKLREKLNTLAISVMNQWPGVKVRVIEGWDEEHLHSTNSLHYEGRAVDIQTSDKDWSKYGMLARLAVEAGFDWVLYESRAHIHCSVKSDSFQSGRAGGCFSANSTVETVTGTKIMAEVEIGDEVLTLDSNGKVTYSPVILFMDRNRTEVREFYEIQTDSGQILRLTPAHLLYIIPTATAKVTTIKSSNLVHFLGQTEESTNAELMALAEITFARNIAIGDWILSVDRNQSKVERSRVLRVNALKLQGVFAPLTTTGTVIVNGVVSSCYAVVESQALAHLSFLPFRLIHNFQEGVTHLWKKVNFMVTKGHSPAGNSSVVNRLSQKSLKSEVKKNETEDEGVNWYASLLYTLTDKILPDSFLYHY